MKHSDEFRNWLANMYDVPLEFLPTESVGHVEQAEAMQQDLKDFIAQRPDAP